MQFRKRLRVAVPIIILLLLFSITASSDFFTGFVSASEKRDEKIYYLLTDHLGSIDVVLDEEGIVVERRDYLPYGAERVSELIPDSAKTAHGFTGKELDDETSLNYYSARYYDTVAGRFIQEDPILRNIAKMALNERNAFLSNPQNLHMYAYVRNNPVNYVDPTGMYGEDVHYDLTYYLCLQAGLKQGQSKVIAYRNQDMDHNWETRPENAKVTTKYHFANRAEARERVNAAIEAKSSPELGDALHTFQDTYSHYGLTPAEHIKRNLHANPDRTFTDVQKSLGMAKETFFYLRKHNIKTRGSDDLSASEYRKEGVRIWNSIRSDVEDYLGRKDKTDTLIARDAKDVKKED